VKKKKAKKKSNTLKSVTTPWGSYQYIYVDLLNGIVIKKLTIKEGNRFSLQSHSHRIENWKIIYSQGNQFSIIKESNTLSYYISETNHNFNSDMITIFSGEKHRAEALVGDLEIIEISTFSPYLYYTTLEEFESDIRRYHDDYGRA